MTICVPHSTFCLFIISISCTLNQVTCDVVSNGVGQEQQIKSFKVEQRQPRQEVDSVEDVIETIGGIVDNDELLSSLARVPLWITTFSQINRAVSSALNGTDTPNLPTYFIRQGSEAVKIFQALTEAVQSFPQIATRPPAVYPGQQAVRLPAAVGRPSYEPYPGIPPNKVLPSGVFAGSVGYLPTDHFPDEHISLPITQRPFPKTMTPLYRPPPHQSIDIRSSENEDKNYYNILQSPDHLESFLESISKENPSTEAAFTRLPPNTTPRQWQSQKNGIRLPPPTSTYHQQQKPTQQDVYHMEHSNFLDYLEKVYVLERRSSTQRPTPLERVTTAQSANKASQEMMSHVHIHINFQKFSPTTNDTSLEFRVHPENKVNSLFNKYQPQNIEREYTTSPPMKKIYLSTVSEQQPNGGTVVHVNIDVSNMVPNSTQPEHFGRNSAHNSNNKNGHNQNERLKPPKFSKPIYWMNMYYPNGISSSNNKA